jgi:hypothetical protein
MTIDVDQLIGDIKTAVTGILQQDVAQIRGFAERQVRALAQQAAFVEAGILSGQITEQTRDFFLDNLEDMARNFVMALRGLTTITIERVWNAVVSVLWRAIGAGTNLALPLPI